MAIADGSAEQGRGYQHPQRAGFAELLFDVVLVFTFTRLSARILDHLTWEAFYSTIVLALAIWWLWYRMAWTTNRYDPTRPAIQVMVIGTMLGGLLISAAVPEAYGERGAIFAGVYVAIQTLRHLWLALLGGDRTVQLASVRIFFWACLSGVPWLAGIAADGRERLMLWSVAVAVDYLGGFLDFPTPRLGRAGLRGLTVAEEHLTERFRQVLIIAFGETILLSGLRFSPYGFERERTLALLVAFAITVLMWQIYFYRAGELLPTAIASARAPAHVGELASYAHLLMVLGAGVSGIGDELIITHPAGETEPSWVPFIFGGPALFLIGRALLDYTAFSRVSWSRPAGLLLLAALAPVGRWLPPTVAALVAASVLAVIAVANIISWRIYPRAPAPPLGPPS